MSDDPRLPYAVRGGRKSGVVTFLCPSPQWALRKLADFEKAGYTAITVKGPGGASVTKADLDALVARETPTVGGGPISIDAPSAPELVA